MSSDTENIKNDKKKHEISKTSLHESTFYDQIQDDDLFIFDDESDDDPLESFFKEKTEDEDKIFKESVSEDELFKFESSDEEQFNYYDFAVETENASDKEFYKILVVDDDKDVHTVTYMALRNIAFNDRKLKIYSAFSAEEAKKFLERYDDIALILLDVVMETKDAGLRLVEYIRDEIKNDTVRIILRTGQPGKAPEREVIVGYDINDYKSKVELTSDKLFTVVISGIRNYDLLLKKKNYSLLLEDKIAQRTKNIEEKKRQLALLLEKTLKGSIKILLDILATVSPETFTRTQRYVMLAKKIGAYLNYGNAWELELTVMLSQIGCLAVPDHILIQKFSGNKLEKEEASLFYSHPKIAASLIKKIPNLEKISDAIECQLLSYTSLLKTVDSKNSKIVFLSSILKTVIDYDFLVITGRSEKEAVKIMENNQGRYHNHIFLALKEVVTKIDKGVEVQEVYLKDIVTDSILAEDLYDIKGNLLLAKGRVMSKFMKIKLLNYSKINKIKEPIKITVSK